MKVIENLNNRIGPHVQTVLDNKKFELKEYTKKVVRYHDEHELVENIASKQYAHEEPQASGSRKWI